MRVEKFNYICDDCHAEKFFKSYKKARAAGWALSRDYKSCFCPECASAHRLGGAKCKKINNLLPEGYTQLSFGEANNE